MQCNAMCNPTKSHHMIKKLTHETMHRNAIRKRRIKRRRKVTKHIKSQKAMQM
ncbi:hypothetical protein BofuT4_uP028280.1 [Botrytis cinerea T4]|uniref:Uncharacterized protein n=1 Tax=Botryotinia fuckeliana (strain T4) TaxID=999810 RepID=G2Y9T5_BOTF4|nr:hypothetical protein BofuT4_uP028280.1 [Botrytis cinerea T4]